MEYSNKGIEKLVGVHHNVIRVIAKRDSVSLHILAPSACDEGAFSPAQDIYLCGVEELITLRDELSRALELATEHRIIKS